MQKKFSFPIKIDELNQNQYKYILSPDADELKDITAILLVENVLSFRGEVFLKLNIKEHLLKVWGNVKALLELKSVISLENFQKPYDIPFEMYFDTKATYQDIRDMESDINDEVPDIIENGTINLADICLEQIALQLDDYPRAEGEIFDFSQYATSQDVTEDKPENPFAVLQKLKK